MISYFVQQTVIQMTLTIACLDCLSESQFNYSVQKSNIKNGESLDEITRDVLNNLTPAALPSHILNIKIGASVMLLRNMNIKLGLCNGTRLKVIAIKPSVIQCNILTGPTAGTVVFVQKMDITTTDTDYQFILHRHYFPLKQCYAMIINKSQGQTLNKVQKNECFENFLD
ncbi:MAG: putative ATP-dependent DNA helicase PIF1 [Streblomastix strix]|uniref:Putative ATP-dependent DNA helicase PIF1 n=1 Tax=Streblomastix strix TaxID=222440 RepID=A0A5J4W649_9EUKA|nr:MAG: putative ATP-dependent DNA helicase PIF1 [Streblomastix strix]